MSSQSKKLNGADVVNLNRVRVGTTARSKQGMQSGVSKISMPAHLRDSATLLSIRKTLCHQASVGLRDVGDQYRQLSKTEASTIMISLRALLDAEFGNLRVHRYRQVFTVGHHCQESLMAGLLRVQYHMREMRIAIAAESVDSDAYYTPHIVWGVGETMHEAETQRLIRCQRSHR